ncbi:metabolite traffic protein EboE [Streptomyces sp. NPDC051776]|uniref:metabolite traffic protein EboE n=1 Tax=Streptomyces sp. NPDC051776 TaxID=3155414 RepID=UPI0034417139
MRFRHPDGSTIHLAYCTNVHPAEDLAGVRRMLHDHAEPVRRCLGRKTLGIGLWLSHHVARTLIEDTAALHDLKTDIHSRGLEVVTLNGFPYQGFGDRAVKYRVYRPDWTQSERGKHTLDLAHLLTVLLPDDVIEGSISTLPLAWRHPFGPERARTARRALAALSEQLDAMDRRTGRSIRVGLEPEPGCVVETTAQAVDALTAPGAPPHHRVGVCIDTCHLATQFEDPATAVDHLLDAGIPIVKAQLSAALHADDPHLPSVTQALATYAEPRFLHQTRALTPDGTIHGTDDLDHALTGHSPLPVSGPWRCHFHVPLHAPPEPPLTSTMPVLRDTLARLLGGPSPLTRHLEVETYTWQALPTPVRPTDPGQLAAGIAAELALVRDHLIDLGLKEEVE